MSNEEFNKAENAVNKVKWTVNDYAEKAKEYIREQRDKNEDATQEGWLDRVKNNVSDAWEDTKDAASNAWESTKDWADDAWDKTKDAAEDVKSEIRKSTN